MSAVDGENVALRCVADGYPQPAITWRREDGDKIVIKQGKRREKGRRYFVIVTDDVIKIGFNFFL